MLPTSVQVIHLARRAASVQPSRPLSVMPGHALLEPHSLSYSMQSVNQRLNIHPPPTTTATEISQEQNVKPDVGCCDTSSQINQGLPRSDIMHPLISWVVLIQAGF